MRQVWMQLYAFLSFIWDESWAESSSRPSYEILFENLKFKLEVVNMMGSILIV